MQRYTMCIFTLHSFARYIVSNAMNGYNYITNKSGTKNFHDRSHLPCLSIVLRRADEKYTKKNAHLQSDYFTVFFFCVPHLAKTIAEIALPPMLFCDPVPRIIHFHSIALLLTFIVIDEWSKKFAMTFWNYRWAWNGMRSALARVKHTDPNKQCWWTSAGKSCANAKQCNNVTSSLLRLFL